MFTPVDEHLVLQDATQRLDIYHVLGHSHMANAVFAWLPAARIMMEGDLGDTAWTWHWWASALNANIKAYGINPRLNVAVHGPNGGLSLEATLANNQRQLEAAQKFCAQQRRRRECRCSAARSSTTTRARCRCPPAEEHRYRIEE